MSDQQPTGFFEALLNSPTFWSEIVGRLGLALVSLLFFGWIVMVLSHRVQERRKKQSRGGIAADESGNTIVVELVILAPILLMLFAFLGQVLILTRIAMVTHYSAYAAARSARVHMPIADGIANKTRSTPPGTCIAGGAITQALEARPVSCDYQRLAESAARRVLVTASPTDTTLSCLGPCDVPAFFDRIDFRGRLGERGRDEAMNIRARYAYDLGTPALGPNVKVLVVFGESAIGLEGARAEDLFGADLAFTEGTNKLSSISGVRDMDLAYPVTARVTYRAQFLVPFFRNLCLRGDMCMFNATPLGNTGRYYAPVSAEVTVY